MNYIEIIGIPKEINLFPNNIYEEVTQNIRTLLITIIGSVPLDRKLGIETDFIDMPFNVAMMKAKLFVMETIHENEPRVIVDSVNFVDGIAETLQGNAIPKVKVRIKNEFI